MTSQQGAADEAAFKDYCLILQLHPDADAEMVDAAYWHLARRYGDARATDPTARERMDDLNEAYSVMRSPERRAEYLKLREAVLGVGALPMLPMPSREPLPMAVMEKGRGRLLASEETVEEIEGPLGLLSEVSLPSWNVLGAVFMVALAGAAFLRWTDRAVIGALLVIGLALIMVPLLVRLPKLQLPKLSLTIPAPVLARQPAHQRTLEVGPPAAKHARREPEADAPEEGPIERAPRGREPNAPRAPGLDPDALRASTKAIRARLRQAAGDDGAGDTPKGSRAGPAEPDDNNSGAA